jgi:nucleotide-binding universal stress UspA family protein
MIVIKRILVPIDLTAASVPAVGYASSLAMQSQAEVFPLHVLSIDVLKPNLAGAYGDQFTYPAQGPANTRLTTELESVCESKQRGVQLFLDQKLGASFAAAKEHQCDLIVMMTQAGRLRRLFGGSITERIIRHAPCPVLSMHASAHVRTEKDERLEVAVVERWAA